MREILTQHQLDASIRSFLSRKLGEHPDVKDTSIHMNVSGRQSDGGKIADTAFSGDYIVRGM